jgi:hypothetical protein
VCAKVVVVATSAQLQLDRLMARNTALTRQEAMDRISSQLPVADKVKWADRVRGALRRALLKQPTHLHATRCLIDMQPTSMSAPASCHHHLAGWLINCGGASTLCAGPVERWYLARV